MVIDFIYLRPPLTLSIFLALWVALDLTCLHYHFGLSLSHLLLDIRVSYPDLKRIDGPFIKPNCFNISGVVRELELEETFRWDKPGMRNYKGLDGRSFGRTNHSSLPHQTPISVLGSIACSTGFISSSSSNGWITSPAVLSLGDEKEPRIFLPKSLVTRVAKLYLSCWVGNKIWMGFAQLAGGGSPWSPTSLVEIWQ